MRYIIIASKKEFGELLSAALTGNVSQIDEKTETIIAMVRHDSPLGNLITDYMLDVADKQDRDQMFKGFFAKKIIQ